MSAPSTSTQVAENSILDLNGRQIYLGNGFMLPDAGASLTDTSEHPVVVITNPSGSGKSLFLFNRTLVTNNNPVIVRVYLNPVLNVAGSTTVALNLRTGATTTSVSVNYLGATITSNGTLFSALPASNLGTTSTTLIIIDPGTSILMTGQQAGAGTTLVVAENAWYEI